MGRCSPSVRNGHGLRILPVQNNFVAVDLTIRPLGFRHYIAHTRQQFVRKSFRDARVLGPVSGCHVNPAVSVGLLVSGNCSFLKTVCYIVCQCCGAIAGSGVLKLLIPKEAIGQGLGATGLGEKVSESQGIFMEAIITFLLLLVVHAVTDPKRTDTKGWAPLAIGLTITVSHMAAVPVTGSSMNPARTLGPAVILGEWKDLWVYWIGPIIGACAAGVLYKMAFRRKKEDDEASYDF